MSTEVAPEVGQRQPDWWHRDHPTFTPIVGFFSGLLFVALVPAGFLALLTVFFNDDVVRGLSPLMATTLIVPAGLVAWRRTRKFGLYMLLGMFVTAIVVVGVATLVLWLLARSEV